MKPGPAPATTPPPGVLAMLVVLLGLAAAFCVLLWPQWRSNPDLSHGIFAPAVFLLLIYESRRLGTLRWLPVTGGTFAALRIVLVLGFAFFALAGLFAASLAWTHALVCLLLAASLAAFLLAGLIILAGEDLRLVPCNWISLTAIFLWLLATPLPDGTYARLTLALQHWVTGGVMQTLHLFGVPARQHGNIIELATTSVGVEEACSGIRSLLSCIYAGFFFAAWQLRHTGTRLGLIVAAPLLALAMNFLRSLLLTLLANSGKEISGFWHDATGFAILGVTAILLASLAILLESKTPAPAPAATPSAAMRAPRRSQQWFWTGLGLTAALGGFFAVNSRPPRRAGEHAPSLATFLPLRAEGWQVLTPKDLYQFADILQTSHLMERSYLRTTGNGQFTQLTVYVAYWSPGQASVSRVASHTPDACWPGAGWTARPLIDARQTPVLPGLPIAAGEHRLFTSPEGYPQNVWFWHIYDGRVISYRDPYSVPALFQIALQYGFRRQGDQFFVRVSSNKSWRELADEPLVREIFANLKTIGL
ncbi:MAG: hypothetical protein JWQ62_2840 [Lacunisphaera sp.]|nr:hypothetical protein [Lacunisphaera sp.]